MVVGEASLLGVERSQEREEEIFCARRRRSSESDETPEPLVMLIVVSCGDDERGRAELHFGSRKSFDDPDRAGTVGAEPNRICVIGG